MTTLNVKLNENCKICNNMAAFISKKIEDKLGKTEYMTLISTKCKNGNALGLPLTDVHRCLMKSKSINKKCVFEENFILPNWFWRKSPHLHSFFPRTSKIEVQVGCP